MKAHLTIFPKIKLLVLLLILTIPDESQSQVLTSDSLALVALYNSTDGENWNNNDNWLIEPVDEWFGVGTTGNRVTLLGWLSGNGLNGSIPVELGDLSALRTLYLQGNDLTGSIPSELEGLSNLEVLYLYENELSGSIPPELGNLSKLKELILSKNELTGQIPKELGGLSNLTELTITQNQLSGSIPEELGDLSNLKFLLLWGNELTGQIPQEFSNLSDILRLNLMDNQLEGELPAELGELPLIRDLIVNENNLTGAIPSSFSGLTTLLTFNISLNQFNALPDLTSLTKLTLFDVSSNCFGEDDLLPNESVITLNTGQNDCGASIIISSQPEGAGECEGSNVSFTVSASGATNLQYQWQENQGSGFINLLDGVDVSGSSTSTLAVMNIQSGANGFLYRCVVSGDNADDVVSDEVNLTVVEPIDITSHPTSQSVAIGQSIAFSVAANGNDPVYQWQKDGADISGATSGTLSLSSVALSDAGAYLCNVTNDCGTITSDEATLIVNDANPNPLSTISIDNLFVYPNPSYGQLYIDGLTEGLEWSITFIDLSGRKVRELQFLERSNSLDISSLSRGVYWVSIWSGRERIHSQRVVLK